MRPERFELPTNWFEASDANQIKYLNIIDLKVYIFPINALENLA